jgi:energy-coupling factor transporter transmembrane protein EcfT
MTMVFGRSPAAARRARWGEAGRWRTAAGTAPTAAGLAPAAYVSTANILFGRFNADAPALIQLGPLRVTGVALVNASSLVARLVALGAFSAVFVRTTDPSDLVLSLVHQARLSYRVAFGTLVGLRMLPLLQGEYATIRAAHRVRGIDEGRGLRGTWRRIRRYSIPLLAGAVRKAGRVALAMDARAFGAYDDRTYMRRLVVTGADWVFWPWWSAGSWPSSWG